MNTKENKIKIGISVGDLNGIGSEIILKTFENQIMFDFGTPIVFSSSKPLSFCKKHFQLRTGLHTITSVDQAVPNKVNTLSFSDENSTVDFGKEDPKAGDYAIQSFRSAVQALKDGLIDVLVTAPIHKKNIQSESFTFPGHTDYLNQELEGNGLMLMIANSLRVGLLTDHVPLSEVSSLITPELLTSKVSTLYSSLQQDFGIAKPKIAILGLNPHSGDQGIIGTEDDTVLKPTIAKIQEEGKLVYGPYSSDSFFGSSAYESFDGILACYHDQGLIPFKTLSFGNGVNYTAGLSHVRTSPDHGTAFEIAGKGKADVSSFREAIYAALRIYDKRREYQTLTANPLKRQPRKRNAPDRMDKAKRSRNTNKEETTLP